MALLTDIQKNKLLALLIDPDKVDISQIPDICRRSEKAGFGLFLVGGSLVFNDTDAIIQSIKRVSSLPVYIFPGSVYQLSPHADGIFFNSLVSGRNPEYLIGQQVIAAPILKKYKLDIIPVAYMLIDGGCKTSVEYMSNTSPIPQDKTDIIIATALASEMLGFKMLYLEAGSGAINPVSPQLIYMVSKNVSIPIIVGGGIKNAAMAKECFANGAQMVVVGTAIEEDYNKIESFTIKRTSKN
jgi:putative glycerol-1-phosphate prenyltransferase